MFFFFHLIMANDIEIAATVAVIISLMLLLKKKKKGRKRSIWVKPWLTRRETRGIDNNLVRVLRLEDEEEYKMFLRTDAETFVELLNLIKSDIEKQTTHLRDPIPSHVKLAEAIEFLATGCKYFDLQCMKFCRFLVTYVINFA